MHNNKDNDTHMAYILVGFKMGSKNEFENEMGKTRIMF